MSAAPIVRPASSVLPPPSRLRVEQHRGGDDRRHLVDAELLQQRIRRRLHFALPVAAVVDHLVDRERALAVPDPRGRAEVAERVDVRSLPARLAAHLLHVRGVQRVAHAAGRARLELELLRELRARHRVRQLVRELVAARPRRGEIRRAALPGPGPQRVRHAPLVALGPRRQRNAGGIGGVLGHDFPDRTNGWRARVIVAARQAAPNRDGSPARRFRSPRRGAARSPGCSRRA